METGKHDWRRFDALTDAEVHEAALKDPDAQPLTDVALARMKPAARARILRRALGLTQEEFAARYRIPIGTLRDWEQGRAQPDQPARAYLTVIAHDPEGVRRALEARSGLDPARHLILARAVRPTADPRRAGRCRRQRHIDEKSYRANSTVSSSTSKAAYREASLICSGSRQGYSARI